MPETFDSKFGVMLFYGGSRCPYCNTQLRAFQRASGALGDGETPFATPRPGTDIVLEM